MELILHNIECYNIKSYLPSLPMLSILQGYNDPQDYTIFSMIFSLKYTNYHNIWK